MSRQLRARSCPTSPGTRSSRSRSVAQAHPDGIVDLSVGTPVDPTPALVREALAAAADAPGYPQTLGHRRPARGGRRLVRAPPRRPGRRPGRRAADDGLQGAGGLAADPARPRRGRRRRHPRGRLPHLRRRRPAGRRDPVVVDGLAAYGPQTAATRPSWCGSTRPSNPTGAVLGAAHLAQGRRLGARATASWWRATSATPSSGWSDVRRCRASSTREVCGGSHEGLLAVYSLSKQSNLAGYRAAFVAGDPALVRRLLEVRKHAGMIVPGAGAARDGRGAGRRRARRRAEQRYAAPARLAADALRAGRASGSTHSEAGLYLWVHPRRRLLGTVAWLAERGVLVAPGTFYGAAGARHVRVALTATDERIAGGRRPLAERRRHERSGDRSRRSARLAGSVLSIARVRCDRHRVDAAYRPGGYCAVAWTRRRTTPATVAAEVRHASDAAMSPRPSSSSSTDKSLTLPVVHATDGADGVDDLAPAQGHRHGHLDPGFVNTASCKSRDHLHRR